MRSLLAILLLTAPNLAQEEVEFTLQHTPAAGAAVFLQGTLPELGNGNVLKALWTHADDGRNWSVTVELPLGRTYDYRFLERQIDGNVIGDAANGTAITDWTTAATAPDPDPERKLLQAFSTFDAPTLYWKGPDGVLHESELVPFAPGRVAGEQRYLAPPFGLAGDPLSFFLEGQGVGEREPASGFHKTDLDEFLLQDGALYTYLPEADVAPARADYDPTAPPSLHSDVLDMERLYRVRLPRGYDQHLERRYPVLYLYDGQWLWEGVGQGYGVFDVDGERHAALVDEGVLAEAILVGIDFPAAENLQDILVARWKDCGPPEDQWGGERGGADRFLEFVTTELKPRIDADYRTLPGRAHTALQGFSFGGVMATYATWEFDHVFGGVAIQSPSWGYTPNLMDRLANEPRRAARVYVDAGSDEGALYDWTHPVATMLLGKTPPYVSSRDHVFKVGYDHKHLYHHASKRLRNLGGLLMPMTEEPATLTRGERYCVGTVNSTGRAARLFAEDDLTLAAIDVPAGAFGSFLVGDAAADLPAFLGGLGRQCVGGNLTRLDTVEANAHGVLRSVQGLGALTAPGSTLYVQAWYRDGGSSNTSDALVLELLP